MSLVQRLVTFCWKYGPFVFRGFLWEIFYGAIENMIRIGIMVDIIY
jgi:hypothetical protein